MVGLPPYLSQSPLSSNRTLLILLERNADSAGNRLELFLGVVIGAIFSGSVIAFGSFLENISFDYFKERQLFFGQHFINLIVGLSIIVLGAVH